MPNERQIDLGGERRRVTVLFCDLVGSTRLSDALDPEDYSDAMHAYYDACARVIEGLGGWIADYLGDGLVVYFGYPEAHEDDPVRAVRAGLRLVDAVSDIRIQLSGSGGGLACRVGIETGLVVIGETGVRPREPIWALGRTVNVAARLQAIGSPNTVVIGEGTYALVGGWFEFAPLGQHSIKGIAEPLDVAQVTAETGAKNRVAASFPRNLTPLVDRGSELAMLHDAWRNAEAGTGSAVVLRGEAGIGKSRLALSLRERLQDVAKSLVMLYCSNDEATSPLRPVVEHLERETGFEATDPAERRVGLLEAYLQQSGVDDVDAVSLLAEILIPEARKPVAAAPEERRRRAMDLLCGLLLRDTPPRLLIVEDVHWADPSTAELMAMILERVAHRRALVVLTTRPEFVPGWEPLDAVTTMDLPSLAAGDTAELAASVAGAQLPREGQALILTRSGGVPLFVEELTRMVLDSGLVAVEAGSARMQGRIVEESVPGTVYDLLIARLGRLGSEAGVAQLASVLGNEFTTTFLRAVAPEEPDLDQKLERLVSLGVVQRSGEEREETFRFSHTLVRDAAYGLLLRKRRRELHGRVADVLVKEFPETVLARPELAAPHFTQSGRVEEAIAQWRKAGERAAAQCALHEAIDHYTRALDLVRSLPGSPERARQEIEISFALGPVIQNASGFADPRVGELYGRVAELSHWLESDGERFTFLAYGYAINMVRADYEAARTIATQLVQVASRQGSTARKLLAHTSLGTTLFQLGEIEQAMPLLDHAIELYDPARHERLITTAAIDPGALCIGYRAWGEWHLGKADRARRTVAELLALVEDHPHPFRTATAHVWVAGLAQRMREPDGVLRYTQSALELAAEHDYEELERYALCLRGWAMAASGDPGGGVTTIRRGLALVPHGGSRAHASWHLAMLAEAELLGENPAEALDAVRRALAFVDETGERVLEPDIRRLEAEILSASGAPQAEIEATLAAAAAGARKQGSLPFELRAAVALHRLRGDDESRGAVAACYASFDEGSDTADLIEARAVLDGARS
jgi:class 3 adenylate cyclase/tetratricopeptide (TPR) repeat protein